ncbi:hypothetical protein EKO27_g8557 [Xylaria grammica]|uniref:Uncharacterized protein n=1 Tax=Xylaria grammica TaxID=363999 RepID=A0A439CWN9_9PEZI|nr:hypothetical protein EKO27_g8557 [Xylaria grammica]
MSIDRQTTAEAKYLPKYEDVSLLFDMQLEIAAIRTESKFRSKEASKAAATCRSYTNQADAYIRRDGAQGKHDDRNRGPDEREKVGVHVQAAKRLVPELPAHMCSVDRCCRRQQVLERRNGSRWHGTHPRYLDAVSPTAKELCRSPIFKRADRRHGGRSERKQGGQHRAAQGDEAAFGGAGAYESEDSREKAEEHARCGCGCFDRLAGVLQEAIEDGLNGAFEKRRASVPAVLQWSSRTASNTSANCGYHLVNLGEANGSMAGVWIKYLFGDMVQMEENAGARRYQKRATVLVDDPKADKAGEYHWSHILLPGDI